MKPSEEGIVRGISRSWCNRMLAASATVFASAVVIAAGRNDPASDRSPEKVITAGTTAGRYADSVQPTPAPIAQTYPDWVPGGIWKPLMEFENPFGRLGVVFQGAAFNPSTNAFFTRGPNGRACATCHQPANAMSISVDTIRKRWAEAKERDPLFASIDGSNCPSLPQAKRESHSLLLNRGLFRISLPWPAQKVIDSKKPAEITIEVIRDPTGCNIDPVYGLRSKRPMVSVFRRPRMVANLRFVETPKYDVNFKNMLPIERDPETGLRSGMSMMSDARATSLRAQMVDAGRSHLELTGARTLRELEQIEWFEHRVYVAQNYSNMAGKLHGPGVPKALGVEAMVTGKTHVNGNDFDTGVFLLMPEWKVAHPKTSSDKFKASVARGYDIFFKRPFWISDTTGINNIRLGNPYKQTCAFCHNTQLTGHDDVPGWMDLGTANQPWATPDPDLPLFKITCAPWADPHPYLGRTIYTTDPGRALITGKCEDVGGIVMQQFRGMAARPPYFANGSAKTIRDVINFYNRRYNIGLTHQEKTDLVNFLSVL